MPQILLPRDLPGSGAFATAREWARWGVDHSVGEYADGRTVEVITLSSRASGTRARRLPWLRDACDRVVVAVVSPLPDWLAGDSVGERLARLADWERELGLWAAQAPLVVATTTPTSLDELILLAAGYRPPLLDLVAGAPAAEASTPLAVRFAAAASAQVGEPFRAGWVSRDLGLADATESAAAASAAVAGVPPAEAAELRAATRALLDRLATAGMGIVGPRDALLWPLPVSADAVPLDLAADVVLAALRGVPERIDAVTLGLEGRLAEIDELDARLRERRHELAEATPRARDLARLSGRDLLRLLAGRRG